MERRVIISPLNQFRFIPLDEVLPAKYNTLPFDKTMFFESLRYWETKVNYTQKVMQIDPMHCQIWSTQNGTPASMSVYKCDGTIVGAPVNFSYPPGMPAIYEYGIQRYVHRLKDLHFFESLDGVYYLVIEVPFDTGGEGIVIDKFTSEPILVKEKHPKTMLWEYGHSQNKDFIIFEQTRQKFAMRVEAALTDMDQKMDLSVFVDQGQNSKLLSATAFRTRKLTIGFGQPVPDWMLEKAAHIMTLDGVYSDGQGYALREDSKWEKKQEDRYPLYSSTIEIGEKDNKAVYEFVRGGMTLIETIPPYPFVIYSTDIGYTNNIDYSYYNPVRIANETAFNAWITARNLEIEAEGMQGSISHISGALVYNRGVGETYNYSRSAVLPYRTGIVNQTTLGNLTISTGMILSAASGNARYVVTNPINGIVAFGTVPSTGQSIVIPDYITPSAGFYNYEVWHDGTINQVAFSGARIIGISRFGIDSNLPPLKTFSLANSVVLTSFSIWDDLRPAKATLESVLLNNNKLNNLGAGYFNVADGEPRWPKLKAISLRQNNLSSATLDLFFNNVGATAYLSGALGPTPFPTGGSINTGAQSPTAVPTGSSAFYRNDLTMTFGWTITLT